MADVLKDREEPDMPGEQPGDKALRDGNVEKGKFLSHTDVPRWPLPSGPTAASSLQASHALSFPFSFVYKIVLSGGMVHLSHRWRSGEC